MIHTPQDSGHQEQIGELTAKNCYPIEEYINSGDGDLLHPDVYSFRKQTLSSPRSVSLDLISPA